MESIGFTVPVLPKKTDAARASMTACAQGERKAAYEDSRRRAGITRETAFVQSTPGGDVMVVYIEADDINRALQVVATSDEPFDRWFRDEVRDVHGVSLEQGFPPPERILDYHAEIA
jgi:hypothetical protein